MLEQFQKATQALLERVKELEARIEALEAKRGPGRPPKVINEPDPRGD